MPDPNLQRKIHKNLMFTIRAALGTRIFQHIYVVDKRDGREFDALDDGSGACAYVISGILALHGLIDHPHATVATTVKTMAEAGWHQTPTPRPGDVVIWPHKNDHGHIGFYLGPDECMSNSTPLKYPVIHKLTMPDGRTPSAYYTLDALHSS